MDNNIQNSTNNNFISNEETYTSEPINQGSIIATDSFSANSTLLNIAPDNVENIANSSSQEATKLSQDAAPQTFRTQNNDIQALENNLSIDNIEVGTAVDFEKIDARDGSYGTSNPYDFINQGKAGLFIVGDVNPNKPLTVYVHGINGTPLDMKPLAEENKDTNVAVFSYPTGLSIDKSGELLSNSINKYTQDNEISDVNIVAHSLGGRVTMSALQNNAEKGINNVNNVVTIASPMGGDWRAAGSQVADELFGGPFIPPSWVDLSPDSENYNNLKGLDLSNINYTAIYTQDKDTKVSGTSQRDSIIAQQAKESFEIDDSHIGVLSDESTFDIISDALSTPKTQDNSNINYKKPLYNDNSFQSIELSSNSNGENALSYTTTRDYSTFHGENTAQLTNKHDGYEFVVDTQLGLGAGANQRNQNGYYGSGAVNVGIGYDTKDNNPFIQTAVNGEVGYKKNDYNLNLNTGINVQTNQGTDVHLGVGSQYNITDSLTVNTNHVAEYSNDHASFNNTVGLEYKY